MTKRKIIGLVLFGATAFAFGRYMTPEKIVEVERKDKITQKDTDKNTTKNTTQEEVRKPDGTVTIITKTEETTNTSRSTNIKEHEEKEKTTDYGRNRVTLLATAGIDVTNLSGGYVYGGSVSKPMLGPIVLGVWGMSNGLAGVSAGLQF